MAAPIQQIVTPQTILGMPMEYAYTVLGAAALFVIKELWDFAKSGARKEHERMLSMIDKNNDNLHKLSLSLVSLEGTVKNLTDRLAPMGKLQADIRSAHRKFRKLKEEHGIDLTLSVESDD